MSVREIKAYIIDGEYELDHQLSSTADLIVTTNGKIIKSRYGCTNYDQKLESYLQRILDKVEMLTNKEK